MSTLAHPSESPAIRPGLTMKQAAGAILGDAEDIGMLLDCSARTVRRMNSAELLPRPVRVMGSVKWVLSEIVDWIDAGCPPRARWESIRKQSG